jgi:putative ABC transport system permease protein
VLEGSRDLRFGLRQMRQRPGSSLLIVVLLAAGIGANTAVFSVVDAFLLRHLPFPGADRLVEVESRFGGTELRVSYPDYLDLRARSRSFVDLAFFHSDVQANLGAAGGTETVQATLATANLFPLLGVRPILGRWPGAEEDRPGVECVVVLSQGLWERRFAGDPRILGRKVVLEGDPCSVIGVMPGAFRFPSRTEVWESIGQLADPNYRAVRFDSVIGRIRAGVSLAQTQEDVAGVARALAREYPLSNEGVGARVVGLRDVWVGDLRRPLQLLVGACGFLLLMTCASVANLLLGRAVGREREMAIRVALGADRRRLVAQLTAEHLVFAGAGGVLGLLFAVAGVAAVRRAIPVELPSWVTLGVDWTAAGYTVCISAGVALLFGLAPLVQLARAELTSSLKEGQGAGGGRSQRLLRSSLVVLEIALALVLLVGARLMVTSFLRLRQVDPGFRQAGVLMADVNLAFHRNDVSASARFSRLVRAAVAQVAQVPGVQVAGAAVNPPLTGQDVLDRFDVTRFGQSADSQRQNPLVDFRRVSPGYFTALGIGLVRGRVFAETDGPGLPKVAVLGEEAARRLWPHEDPIGGRLKLGTPASPPAWVTVVGVVRDVHQERLADGPGCDLFVCMYQVPAKTFTVLVRTRGEPGGLVRPVRLALASTSPELGVARTTTLREVVAGSIWVTRLWGWLFGLFSALSLLLAAAGIYGVMASAVRERKRELGIRMALGARRRAVLALMLRHGLKLALIGAALGLALATVLARMLASVVFSIDASDPRILVEVALFLVGVVLTASWMASRGATQVDPRIAMRQE